MLNLSDAITRSTLLAPVAGLRHGFTGRELPRSEADALDSRTATGKQVHKAAMIWVDAYEKRAREADAVATLVPGLAVGAYSADCTPVLAAALDASSGRPYAVMAAHAGWRGTALGIAEKAFREFARAARERAPGRAGARFLAAIGPCISFESFEVGEDVIEAFPGCEARGLARYLRDESGRRKYLFDLPGENLRQLREAAAAEGVELEAESVGLCTLRLESRFPSYRRDREKAGKILSYIEFGG